MSAVSGIRYDGGRGARARLGFVLLAMEQTVESDMHRWAPPGVGVHSTRAAMADDVTSENLRAMRAGLAGAAALVLPEGELDVICYACTSGSVVIGEDAVVEELRRGARATHATTLVTGVIRALRALDARRIAVATPYLDEVNRIERDYLEARGFEIASMEGMNISRDADMARVAPQYVRDFALAADRPGADALFVSCGALRTLEILEEIEARAGKPVIASNQAMLWDCLRLAGVEDRIPGLGTLLREC